jgi:hypothetical protein
MAIGDYTDNLGAIEKDAKNQKADLKLSEKVSEAWITPMTNFHLDLENVFDMTRGLDKVPGDVGGLQSAQDTARNLARAVTASGGVQPALNDHMRYQGKLAELVKNAHDLMIKNG